MNLKNILRLLFVGLFTFSCTASSASSSSDEISFSVENSSVAGEKYVRKWLAVPKKYAKIQDITLKDGQGSFIPAQLSPLGMATRDIQVKVKAGHVLREIYFVAPNLKAGGSTTFSFTPSADKPSTKTKSFKWQKDKDGKHVDLLFHDTKVMRYMNEKHDNSNEKDRNRTYKVYHHVFDPSGKFLITKGDGGKFPHHRGIYFGYSKCSFPGGKADVWHCRNGESQTHQKIKSEVAGTVMARHTVLIDWNDNKGKNFANEEREITAVKAHGGLMVEFASTLSTKMKEVSLAGDRQHAGCQFRCSNDVASKTAKETYYIRPDGKDKPGSYRNSASHKNLKFNAISVVIEKERFTVCYLDHPKNPKPAEYTERNYGRFGSYFKTKISPSAPLKINYRFFIKKGEMSVKEIETLQKEFVQTIK